MSLYTPIPSRNPQPESHDDEIIKRIVALGAEHGLKLVREPVRCPATLMAEKFLRQRRQREAVLGKHLFADPCWDMLLDLFVAYKRGLRPISVSSLCLASAVPQTTAIRWIDTLVKGGLVYKEADPKDKRRVFIHLTEQAKQQLDELLGSWAK